MQAGPLEGYRLFMEKDDNELFQEARKLFEKRDYAGVVKTVGLVAQAGRRDLGLARILVLSYSAVGRHDLALEWSEKALQENPEDDEVSRIVAAIRNSFEPDANTSENERSSRWATALPRETLKQIQSGVHRMKYRGIQMLKNPFDIAIYMQLIWNLKPGTIFEIGTHSGGAATWFGDLLANYGLPGRVISIDLLKPTGVVHPRVTFLNGDARVLEEVLDRNFLESSPHPWLVIEDSSHEIITSEAAWHFLPLFFPPETISLLRPELSLTFIRMHIPIIPVARTSPFAACSPNFLTFTRSIDTIVISSATTLPGVPTGLFAGSRRR